MMPNGWSAAEQRDRDRVEADGGRVADAVMSG